MAVGRSPRSFRVRSSGGGRGNVPHRPDRVKGRPLTYNTAPTFHLTLSGPAFSVIRQARGGSEAQMPKIKVNINQLK